MSNVRIQLDFTIPGVPVRFVAAAGLLLLLASELASENVQLTTYYPAPSGVYTQMVTTQNTYLARDAGYVDVGTTASGLAAAGNFSMSVMPVGAQSGYVGLGTTAPFRTLQVGVGAIGAAGVTGTGAFIRQDNNLSDILEVYPQNLTQGVALGYDYIKEIGSNASNALTIDAKGTSNIVLQNNGDALRSATNGFVGIKMVPANPLETAGSGPNNYGGTPEIFVNGDNHTGGGLAISDDGGFYDYNDGYVTYNGDTNSGEGLKIAGNNGAASNGAHLIVQGYINTNHNEALACGIAGVGNDAVDGACNGSVSFLAFTNGVYAEGWSYNSLVTPINPGAGGVGVPYPAGSLIPVTLLCCTK